MNGLAVKLLTSELITKLVDGSLEVYKKEIRYQQFGSYLEVLEMGKRVEKYEVVPKQSQSLSLKPKSFSSSYKPTGQSSGTKASPLMTSNVDVSAIS